ncbi:MAG TPA: glycosyltransferase [Candidatus Eubacterium faecavium]|nr:glycosyltransferase [Candidatus Eubacterium faecavium]
MKNVKVSVIIPVYNAEKYLEKCLDSVTRQTLSEMEIICVDDGSADSSLEILERYAASDPRILIKRQQNLFAGAARNNGMDTAKGKYLVFWDSDDYFEKNALETLYKKCEKEQADICLCGAFTVDGETGKRAVDETFLKRRFLPKGSVFSIKTNPEYIFNMASNTPWQRMFRADFVKAHGLRFQDLRHANDTYFVLCAMFYAERITYTEKPLVNYRTNNALSVTGSASKDPLCAYKAYAAVYEELGKAGLSGKALQSFHSKLLSGLIREIMLQTDENGLKTAYYKIRDEGFAFFGLDKHTEPDYYYFKSDYEDMLFIREHALSEFLIYKYRKENRARLFYKQKAEKSPVIRFARKAARLLPANSSLYDIGKRILHFK